MQVHLPSHTQLTADLPLGGMNSTAEASHDWFCNRPAALNFWGIIPGKGSHTLFEKDMNKRGTKTLNQTLEAHKGKEKSGKTSKPSRSLSSSQHEDTLTIAHELPAFGLSASELCDNALSMGPDFVNLPEGKFCRMSDKTLWPTCNYHSQDGERDNCFDLTSKKLVVGGKVTRNKPYSREMNFPLD
ncbi:hypothetical protein Daus18300_011544 [Diaporthe australafricana]|uniref:Uncharacterized protein n=1 Tax=Diaporthe australafricana TaxID=127596 RepID=A0ABR3W675_9PEZI